MMVRWMEVQMDDGWMTGGLMDGRKDGWTMGGQMNRWWIDKWKVG